MSEAVDIDPIISKLLEGGFHKFNFVLSFLDKKKMGEKKSRNNSNENDSKCVKLRDIDMYLVFEWCICAKSEGKVSY